MRVVVAMFITEPGENTGLAMSPGIVSVLAVALVLTLLVGIYPEPFIDMARQATATLTS
jgi:NADH:ubiquinone oxidoreductase subunit 2 (subunit N)